MAFTDSFTFNKSAGSSKTDKIKIIEEIHAVKNYFTNEAFISDYGYPTGNIPNKKRYEYELSVADGTEKIFAGWYDEDNDVLWIYTKNQILYTEQEIDGEGFKSFGGSDDGINYDYGRGVGTTPTHNYPGFDQDEDTYRTGFSFYNLGAELTVDISIPVYRKREDAMKVARGEEPEELPINEGEEESDTDKYPYRKYYFYNKTFRLSGTRYRTLNADYVGSGRLAGYLSNTEPYNIKLISSGELQTRVNDEEEYHDIVELPALTSNDTLNNFYGILDTNIPIFNNIIDAGEYLLTGNPDDAINAADIEEDSKTGKDGTIARFDRANSYNILPTGQYVYDATDVMRDVIAWMRDISNQSILHALDFYWFGNNPIEAVVGFYWSPLDMHELCKRSEPFTIFLGGIPAGYRGAEQVEYYAAPVCQYQGKEKVLGQYQFARKYNDWRDYTCFSYKLYLPFYGIVELEPYYIVGKRLEVRYIYYPTNHMIHYMIFVKKNIYKEFDCSVGIDLSMTSSDAVGKAQQMFSKGSDILGSGLSAVESGLKLDASGLVGSATNSISSVIDMFKQPSMMTWGNVNPTSNIGDPLQALLFIEEQKCIIPNKLHSLYGYATYYIGLISNLSGYCEFSDVRLKSSATPEEKNQIISMMNSGIII